VLFLGGGLGDGDMEAGLINPLVRMADDVDETVWSSTKFTIAFVEIVTVAGSASEVALGSPPTELLRALGLALLADSDGGF
jgi:hypothetical protein